MSYSPTTDFLGLLRLTGSSLRSERMPGLDWLVVALARAGMFTLFVGQSAPTVNQSTTAWFQPAIPSWAAEGTLYLWNPAALAYQAATPALWQVLLSPTGGTTFQSLTQANNIINPGVSLAAVQRVAPAATAVQLPAINLAPLTVQSDVRLVDFSTNVVNHQITVSPTGGATIMQKNAWTMLSTADSLAGVQFHPSPDLNAWVIAP